MFIVPPLAGGGSCSSWQSRATLGCTAANGCYSFYRTTNATFWTQGLATNLGFTAAVADLNNDGAADSVGDLSDPTTTSYAPWRRFNTPYRQALGWIPSSAVVAAGTLTTVTLATSSSTAAAAPGAIEALQVVTSADTWYISLRTSSDPNSMDAQLRSGAWSVWRVQRVQRVQRLQI